MVAPQVTCHIDSLMSVEVILCQRLRKSIGDLFFSVDVKHLDESFPNMITKVMVAHVDVLGARS